MAAIEAHETGLEGLPRVSTPMTSGWVASCAEDRSPSVVTGLLLGSRTDECWPRRKTMASWDDVAASLTVRALMRRPTGYLPVAMSVGALAMIVWFVAAHGVVHQRDEGAQAHLWQLLVAGQVQLMAYFALRWLPYGGRPAVTLACSPTRRAVVLLAMAPLWALGRL